MGCAQHSIARSAQHTVANIEPPLPPDHTDHYMGKKTKLNNQTKKYKKSA